MNIDNNLASGGDLTNEEIIEQVTVKSTEYQSLNQKESDDEEEEHIINPVSKDEKDKAFETLRMYLFQNSKDCTDLLSSLNKFQGSYEEKTAKPKIQSSLTSFFKL